jgi:lipoprotein-anchoring transpeptidase ErfK/SrfK
VRVRKTASATAAVAGAALVSMASPAIAEAAPSHLTGASQPVQAAQAGAKGTIPGTTCVSGVRACLSLSQNQAWLIKGGKISYGPVPVTTGKPGFETPVGMHEVLWEDIDHRSQQFDNAPMNYSVFFVDGIAFHEGSLYEQSHGCVHLSTTAARTFYNALEEGDAVQVTP